MSEGLVDAAKYYVECCSKYQSPIDATVLVALNCKVPHLSLDPSFDIRNMLPLRDVMVKYARTFTSMSFRKCNLGSTVCYPLRDILKANRLLRVNLDGNNIDYHGAEALADGIRKNTMLQELILRSNRLKLSGAKSLAEALKENKSLKHIDVGANGMTAEGVCLIEKVCEGNKIKCDTTGNAVFEEVLNSITHGAGIIFSLVGGYIMAHDARGYGRAHQWAIALYTASLVLLYSSSTLCHSFVFMKKTGRIFQIMDHAAIYIVIAGTYTPFCLVNLADSWTGTILISAVWILAVAGVLLSAYQVYVKTEMCLYVFMGWMCVLTGHEFFSALPPTATLLLASGGIAYTTGIYFYIAGMKTPVNHVIWHVFVLLGSTLHFFSVREAIFHKTVTDTTWLSDTILQAKHLAQNIVLPPCVCNCNCLPNATLN